MSRKPDDFQWQPLSLEWQRRIRPLLPQGLTPFYLFSAHPIKVRLNELQAAMGSLPVTPWLSVKTQPLPSLLRWWRGQGRPVEVVSDLELRMALRCGFTPQEILVNGPAKHRWLGDHALVGLNVNFDSPREAQLLANVARKHQWRCGVRLNTPSEFDPETPEHPTQFGLDEAALRETTRHLRRAGIEPKVTHFHLRTNLPNATFYLAAAREAMAMCQAAGIKPEVLDLGGGFPATSVFKRNGARIDAEFSLHAIAQTYRMLLKEFPQVRALWIENGRWLSGDSGVLVIRVLDVKERRGMRHLICDGGRTQHALLSIWEHHLLSSLPARKGSAVPTTITGPTCMAFDRIARLPLPRSLKIGDVLIWQGAGAYHLPWETRFSHGLSAVYWNEGKSTQLVRQPESFDLWWKQWEEEGS